MSEKIIMYDSPEAAKPHTMNGWLSRDGIFYAEERLARYSGCTHRPCEACGAPTERMYIKCAACRDAQDTAKYAAMPRAKWDGKAMIYSETLDKYFSGLDEAEDELEDGWTLADLRLVICEPNYVRPLEPDYCCDELPEDGEVPESVLEAMAAFNKAVAGIVLSWTPGKFAVELGNQGAS